MRKPHDEEMIAEAIQFAAELECIAHTAPDDETIRVPLGTTRKAARLLRSVIEDAVEQAAQAKAAHDCVIVSDRLLARKDGIPCRSSSDEPATASRPSASRSS
jgi:hypothetical protein